MRSGCEDENEFENGTTIRHKWQQVGPINFTTPHVFVNSRGVFHGLVHEVFW